MIRSLRQAHRLIAAGLALAVPLAVVPILWLRPAVMSLPIAGASALPRVAAARGLRGRLESRADGGWNADLASDEAAPDLLVYWSQKGLTSPGANAVLLGPLLPQTRSYAIPGTGGVLLIYSVAYGRTWAVVPVSALAPAR